MDRHARAKEAFVESDLRRDCSWNRMYQCLLQYRERHSDTLVLTNKESLTEVKKLGKWAQNQRVHYKYFCNGDRKHIKEHQIEALYQVSVCVRAMMIICDHDVACLVSGFYIGSIPLIFSASLFYYTYCRSGSCGTCSSMHGTRTLPFCPHITRST